MFGVYLDGRPRSARGRAAETADSAGLPMASWRRHRGLLDAELVEDLLLLVGELGAPDRQLTSPDRDRGNDDACARAQPDPR